MSSCSGKIAALPTVDLLLLMDSGTSAKCRAWEVKRKHTEKQFPILQPNRTLQDREDGAKANEQ